VTVAACRNNFAFLKQTGLIPARQVAAIDPGASGIKIVLLESFLGRTRLLRAQTLPIEEEGLLSPEELNPHLQAVLREFGRHPLAIALPQHLTLSQPIDLPPFDFREVRQLIEEETVKLSGLSESAIVYDYHPLRPFGKHQNPFWVTFCQETEVLGQIRKFDLPAEEFCGATSNANALASAFRFVNPEAEAAILVDVGSVSTTVAILLLGQTVYANSFPIGGDAFTESIAAEKGIPREAAELLKKQQNLFSGPEAMSAMIRSVENWHQEWDRLVQEWLQDHPELHLEEAHLPVIVSGGTAQQPGFVEFLNETKGWEFRAWPEHREHPLLDGRYAIGFGAALQALNQADQPASLLPPALRANWKTQRVWQGLQTAAIYLILLIGLVLAGGTWQKARLVQEKNLLLGQARAALEKAEATERLADQLLVEYERVRPVLERQKFTLDTLNTLELLQQAQTNQGFWYVLFADSKSYFDLPNGQTNQPPWTNLAATLSPRPLTNGFIVELAVPQEGEPLRRTLADLVATLENEPLLRNVDSLRADLRRSWVDPAVTLPDRHFALAIELAPNPYQRTISLRQKPPVRAAPSESGPVPRSFRQRAESLTNQPPAR
jgi:Tfp pilus assembly PilM family ATPase